MEVKIEGSDMDDLFLEAKRKLPQEILDFTQGIGQQLKPKFLEVYENLIQALPVAITQDNGGVAAIGEFTRKPGTSGPFKKVKLTVKMEWDEGIDAAENAEEDTDDEEA